LGFGCDCCVEKRNVKTEKIFVKNVKKIKKICIFCKKCVKFDKIKPFFDKFLMAKNHVFVLLKNKINKNI